MTPVIEITPADLVVAMLKAPKAQKLPQRSELDVKIDDAHHRLVFAETVESKLVWAKRLVGFRKQRAAVTAQ